MGRTGASLVAHASQHGHGARRHPSAGCDRGPGPLVGCRRRWLGGIRGAAGVHEIIAVGFDTGKLPETIRDAVAVAKPGAVVSPPPKGTAWGRVAFAIAVADSVGECAQALDAAEAALEVNCT